MERELRHADDCAGTKERKKSRRKKKERKKERKKMRTTTSPFPNPGQIGQQLDGLPSTNKFGKPPSTQGFLSFLIRLLQIVGHGKKGSLAIWDWLKFFHQRMDITVRSHCVQRGRNRSEVRRSRERVGRVETLLCAAADIIHSHTQKRA